MVSLTVGTQQYKMAEIDKIVARLPGRRFVCIGDSTQKDPEAYAAMYRKHPKNVRHIWIRVVEGVNESEEKKLNAAKRFEAAFKGVPKDVWRTYKDPRELDRLVEKLV